VDEPRPRVRRIALNRPEKRNALSGRLRAELFAALAQADRDDAVRVLVLCGAGPCFSAGYDLAGGQPADPPYTTAGGDGHWPRHVVEGAFHIWDMAKPVIAQVHGWCLAGGSELMASCDLAYVSEDARIGYPPVRLMSPPDNQFFPWMAGMRAAMELMLTGDSVSGAEACRIGLANRMGMRAAIRAGTEIQALAFHAKPSREYMREFAQGVRQALDKRDAPFQDYRQDTAHPQG